MVALAYKTKTRTCLILAPRVPRRTRPCRGRTIRTDLVDRFERGWRLSRRARAIRRAAVMLRGGFPTARAYCDPGAGLRLDDPFMRRLVRIAGLLRVASQQERGGKASDRGQSRSSR